MPHLLTANVPISGFPKSLSPWFQISPVWPPLPPIMIWLVLPGIVVDREGYGGEYIGGGACIEIGRIFLQLLAFITINHSLKNPNSLKDLVTFCAGVAQILAKKIPVCHKPRSTFLGPSPSFLCRFSYYLYHIISSFISIKQDDKQHHPNRNWIY